MSIGTDSQSMLDTIFGRDRDGGPAASVPTALPRNLIPLDPLIPEWDLLVEIRYALIHSMPGVKLIYMLKATRTRRRRTIDLLYVRS